MLSAITQEKFTAWQAKYGFTIAGDEVAPLALANAFVNALPLCDDAVDTDSSDDGQAFIAYAMTTGGGNFNPAAIVSNQAVKREKVDSIEIEYQSNALTDADNSPLALLQTIPMAYGLLAPSICENAADLGLKQMGAFVV